MTKIEQTRRAMYDMLEAMRRARKHPTMLRAFEEALEEHLEALRMRNDQQRDIIERAGGVNDLQRQVAERTKERDECEGRMRVIDEAYCKSQEALRVAGEELREVQSLNHNHIETVISLRADLKRCKNYLPDLQSAEAMTDSLHEKLASATAVIAQQEQLIAGQRKAIADMHNELAHRRVICKAFMQARLAFVALDEALHEAPQSKAIRAVGDDKERAGHPAGEGV